MTRIILYDHEAFREVVVPHFTMTACRRFIEREYPRYGAVVMMSYEPMGKIGIVLVKTTITSVCFFGVSVEYIQDRGLPP